MAINIDIPKTPVRIPIPLVGSYDQDLAPLAGTAANNTSNTLNNIPDSGNLYRKFMTVQKLSNENIISKRFDEPTYFSFKLLFGNGDDIYNIATEQAQFDTMPHPLFSTNVSSTTFANNMSNLFVPGSGNVGIPNTATQTSMYSAVDYLINSNEPTRAKMLYDFITQFNDLQTNFPYYFQSIEGVADLLKVDTTKGQRIIDKKITVSCLEGLDLRMSYLLNLYKKIAWDDVYQRWILPDMMRYFTLKIYLAEFRTFHIPSFLETDAISGYGLNLSAPVAKQPVYLRILDDILPVWEITCEMCEFDISDISFTQLDDLNIGKNPEQTTVKFGIKVGNIKELQSYPVFNNAFLIDRKLNGLNRSKDEISTTKQENPNLYPAELLIAQDRKIPSNTSDFHVAGGKPYIERANVDTTAEVKFTQSNVYNDEVPKSTDVVNPETWVGNAITFGKAFAENFVSGAIDKAKITSIPGLGVSFTEVKTAIQSKNIVVALGMIRKGVNEVIQSYGNAPSSKLEGNLQTDNIMKQFLTTLSKSDATDEDTKLLAGAAAIALSDNGVWEQIKDYSLATDLVGKEEKNIGKSIEGAQHYQGIVKENAVYESIEVKGGMTNVNSNAASGDISNEQLHRIIPSSQLAGDIDDGIEQPSSSERLFSVTEGNDLTRKQPSELLGARTQAEYINKEIPSSKLYSDAQKANVQTSIPSSGLDVVRLANISTNATNIKTKNISVNQIIEYEPTSVLNNKIENEALIQPLPSKATNNKIEK